MKKNVGVLCFVVMSFVLSTQSQQIIWSKYIEKKGNIVQLILRNLRLTSTKGLRNYSHITYLDLSLNKLQSLDEIKYLTNLTNLLLFSNQIESLNELENLTILNTLDLSLNRISSFDDISYLKNLETLKLTSNSIASLEPLAQLQNLKYLFISSNQIKSLNHLQTLFNLIKVELYGNQLTSIEFIKNLTNIANLFFSFNQLNTLKGIEDMLLLTDLFLSSNRLVSLKELENLTQLYHLDVSQNQLESLEGLQYLTDLTYLDFKSNRIDSLKEIVNLTKLIHLYMSNNRLKNLESLENMNNLQFLFVDSNLLSSLRGVEKLTYLRYADLRGNFIRNVSSYTFYAFNNLQSILLANNSIGTILSHTFESCRSLLHINLDDNQIETIASFGFTSLARLELLSLRNNRIRVISNNAFYLLNLQKNLVILAENVNLTKISTYSFNYIKSLELSYDSLAQMRQYNSSYFDVASLNLAKNSISIIRSQTIKGKFFYLNLEENNIFKFEANSFGDMPNLKEINLARNLIRLLNFATNAFQTDLKMLTKLNFYSNKIVSIEEGFFSRFPNLNYLDLSANSFLALKSNYFQNLANLKYLDLSKNQILTIDERTFENVSSLTNLNLENNLIYNLSESYFVKLRNLFELYLGENKIESFSKECFKGLDSLTLLDIAHNELMQINNDSFVFTKKLTNLILRLNGKIKSLNGSLLKTLQYLDISMMGLTQVDITNVLRSLIYLDLSHNKLNSSQELNLFVMTNLKVLNVSNTSVEFVLNLTFTNKNLKIEELDLSSNNLTHLKRNYLASLTNLKRLNLRSTFLINFDFIKLLVNIEDLDLTNSQNLIMDPNFSFKSFSASKIKRLEFSYSYLENVTTQNLAYNLLTIQMLNIRGNGLIYFNEVFLTIESLDLSENSFSFMLKEENIFRDFYPKLKFINLTKSLTSKLENMTFIFNKKLEFAYLGQNGLKNWPRFCQICLERECLDGVINIDCKLRFLDFSSNKIEFIYFNDLTDFNNLECLNLENNLIKTIQKNAFSSLFKLETLLLSFNLISSFENDVGIFRFLTSLKHLSLKANRIECIPSLLFKNLPKLETIDLSSNLIYSLEQYSFFNLAYLRNLHLEENEFNIHMVNETFFQINSIQNIYLSKSILSDYTTRLVFINLFETKKRQVNENEEKKVLNVTYFKSLFLMFYYDDYDCELTLYFMRQNLHLNFKNEAQIHDYFDICSMISIKNGQQQKLKEEIFHFLNMFSNLLWWFFNLTLFFILIMGVLCCSCLKVNRDKKIKNDILFVRNYTLKSKTVKTQIETILEPSFPDK